MTKYNNVDEFPILVPNYHSECVCVCIQKTPANGIHIDDDDVSKKISSNRPVMGSN